jgi:hypothetical protein
MTNEISFELPVKIRLIRIIKGGSIIVPRFKANMSTSLTQNDSIKSLEIFAKDLENPSSNYINLVSSTNLKDLFNQDVLFTLPREVFISNMCFIV